MKRHFFLLIILILSIFSMSFYKQSQTLATVDSLSKNAIRFHIRANSDDAIDQSLKLKVKAAVVDYIYRHTRDMDTVDETRHFIVRNNKQILAIAQDTLLEDGCSYNVTSYFGKQQFPDKSYGDVTFPAGEYTSYTIYIGKGKGHNWWCVLYPPLCFTDATCATVPDSSKEKLKNSLDEKQYECITEYKFKYLKFLNKYINQ